MTLYMRKRHAPRRVVSRADLDYLNGLLSAFDELPDGAWRAACESAIESDPRFKGRNPYDVWMAWVEANAVQSKPKGAKK